MRDKVGRYRITAKLGEGGMGIVYAAVDERLDRPLALKMIRQDTATGAAARERFWREAKLAASVNHPHVCQLYEVGEADGELFIAMELLEGEPLAARLSHGPVALAEAVQIVLSILGALDALHRRAIVHRDLKPSNVFLTPHGVKLLDFGLARPIADGLDETRVDLTAPGMIVGTPKYMAPEQLLGRPIDARADLFATAAILYEMLAGRPPFEGESFTELTHRIVYEEPPVLGGSPAVAAADRVIHRALAKDPAERHDSAAAMADDLRTVLVYSDSGEAQRARAITRLIVLPFRLLRPDPEIDFLAFSLAEAITNSLSPLESLVVRSTLAAAKYAADVPDLKAIAADANVDIVLAGTLLRAGNQLRVSTQLVDASTGTVLWSQTSQVPIGDVFQLQDDLARRTVESLALPLSGRESRLLRRDVPASAKAYEFYLRANQFSYDSTSWEVARDLYEQCVQEDPLYAPAWARLARMYRVIGKFGRGAVEENFPKAEAALKRALELNPDLSLAHNVYAQIEVDLGRAADAMVRLIRRASARSGDPDLFAGLVSACRYCGLVEASLAADARARRLDPATRTSVHHTLFMAGEYERCLDVAPDASDSVAGVALAAMGRVDDAIARLHSEAARNPNRLVQNFMLSVQAALRGEHRAVRRFVDELVNSGFSDPEGLFYMAVVVAHVEDIERALELLDRVVETGFFCYPAFTRHPWLEPLRARPEFVAILRKVERRHREARAAFIEAGGEALLGT